MHRISKALGWCVALATMTPLAVMRAQQMYPSYGTARIVGTVRDSISGRTVLRADVCSEIALPVNRGTRLCVNPDSSGYFELTGLPGERNVFAVSCPGLRGELGWRLLHADTLMLVDGSALRIDVRGDASGCDMRPFSIRRGRFTGVLSVAFESASFGSCDGSVHAWPTFTPRAREQFDRVKVRPAISHDFFVTLEGTVRGPAQYGHGGATPYGIDVTRIISIRLAGRNAC